MNYKKKRPTSQRSHCKMCKRWKINGFPTDKEGGEKFSDHRRRKAATAEIADY